MECHNCKENSLNWFKSNIHTMSNGDKLVTTEYHCKNCSSTKLEKEIYRINKGKQKRNKSGKFASKEEISL